MIMSRKESCALKESRSKEGRDVEDQGCCSKQGFPASEVTSDHLREVKWIEG